LNPEDVVSGMHTVYEGSLESDSTDGDEPTEDELVVEDEVVAPKAETPPSNESRFASLPPRARTDSSFPKSMHGVVGMSETLVDLYRIVDRVADTTCTILITGESGTGKEIVARAVHRASPRSEAPFVAVNCGAIPEALLESELFGHARGAFTGAHQAKPGRIAMAQGGTLFLDEIGEMPLALQVKLLRILQSREYSPVGDNRVLKADVRIVAATNINLESAVQAGTFREDLYYRLNVIHVHVPALRERAEDIPLLFHHFLARAKEKLGRPQIMGLSRTAAQLLAEYHWPGNVRELENTIERAVLLCSGNCIEPRDLPQRVLGLGAEKRIAARLPDTGIDLRNAVEAFENQLIRQALERTQWNKKQAAGLLGLNRTTLVEMLKRKRITRAA
ncbi:MAG TPA: sigma-54 dependent transcriptional regulator, partial [Polyangiaceae bacterium]|nr:sigma-54 dependent transcriptional regulator [Polyangiaceae bacterium]